MMKIRTVVERVIWSNCIGFLYFVIDLVDRTTSLLQRIKKSFFSQLY